MQNAEQSKEKLILLPSFCKVYFTKNTFLAHFHKNIWSIQKKVVSLRKILKNEHNHD